MNRWTMSPRSRKRLPNVPIVALVETGAAPERINEPSCAKGTFRLASVRRHSPDTGFG